jgi:hypothetical protein
VVKKKNVRNATAIKEAKKFESGAAAVATKIRVSENTSAVAAEH